MASKTITAKELDVSKISITEVRRLDSGIKVAYVNHNGGVINLQTPELTLTFDSMDHDNTGKHSCMASMKGIESNEQLKEFSDKMKEIESKILKDAGENCVQWLGKKYSEEMILDKFTRIMRQYKDPETGEFTGKYPDNMSFKVVKRDGNFMCKFYDENRKRINVDKEDEDDYVGIEKVLVKGTSFRAILKCTGLWVSNIGFGVSWQAAQMKVKLPENLEEYAFRDEDDFEPEPEKEDEEEEEVDSSDEAESTD